VAASRGVTSSVRPPAPERAAWLGEGWHFAASQASGVLASTVDVVVMEGLILLGTAYGWAILAGHLAGGASDFATKRHLVFRTRGQRPWPQALRYRFAWVGSLLFNLALARLLVGSFGLGAGVGVLAAAVLVGVAWNYPMHRLYVFGARDAR
jgi:putative flippase GtrA